MFHTAWRSALAALGAAILCASSLASEGPPPVLNPRTYASPSGEWALRVEPGEMHGVGEGSYRMTRAGAEAWAGKREYTLWDARVADDGVVAGYAYSRGWRGRPREPGGEWNGDLRVVLITPDNGMRLELVEKRTESRALHSPPTPIVTGIFLDPDNDMFVLRVRDEREENSFPPNVWWRFRTSTGERLANITPNVPRKDGKVTRWEADAAPIPKRALTASVWSRMEWRNDAARQGVTIIVLDLDGKEVARLDRPDEYPTDQDVYAARAAGSLLRSGREPGVFAFRSAAQKGWVSFAVEADAAAPGGWRLTERGLDADAAEAPKPAPAMLDGIALEHRGTIRLQTGAAGPSPIRNIGQFAFDDRGRIGFVRVADEPPTMVIVEQDGRVALEARLDALGADPGMPVAAWVRGDEWVVVTGEHGEEASATALRVNATTGEAERIPIADCPTAIAVRGRADGGFYMLGRRDATYTISQELDAFDAQGQLLWRIEDGHDEPGRILAPQDITATAEGVAVLEGVRDCIQRYDADGKHLGTIKLAEVWGRNPNYVTDLDADADGGFVLFDFDAPKPALRLDAQGKILTSFTPRFADGRVFVVHGGVRRSPSGDLWTSDGDSLLRLGPDGAVVAVAGRAPASEEDPQLVAWTVDARGRIHALNQRTTSVLVFTSTGALERVCRPLPDDFDKEFGSPSVAVSPTGDVFMNTGGWNERAARGYLRFNADGTRVGFEPRRGDWLFRRDGSGRWEVGHETAALLDPAGAVVRTIEHDADGNWLVWINQGSAAPDGSLALISDGRDGFYPDMPTMSMYTATGDRVAAAPCPRDLAHAAFAFDGASAVLANDKGMWVIDAKTRAFRPALLPEALAGVKWAGVLLGPDGREAWAVHGEPPVIERFAMP